MIGWLKYLPLHLRHDHQSSDCRGPSFASAKPIHLVVNACDIRLRAPRHRSRLPDPPHYWGGKESFDLPFRAYNSDLLANEHWSRCTPLSRRWSYWTAWFAGSRSEMYMNVQLLKRADGKEFSGASFFHPRSFEHAVTNFLDVRFGHHETDGHADYQAPLKWKVHQKLPLFSASFLVEHPTGPIIVLTFPARDDTIFWMSFRLRTTVNQAKKQMEDLAWDIINSVTVELSPEVKAQIERVKKNCPDMSLSENFAPLKWPIAKQDIETEEPSGDAEVQQRKIEG